MVAGAGDLPASATTLFVWHMAETTEVLIIGAGLAGIALAYHLTSRHGFSRVVLIDEREPLTLTSDKGTQAYRNWWPGPDNTMLRYMTRSIDLLEEHRKLLAQQGEPTSGSGQRHVGTVHCEVQRRVFDIV